MKKLKTAREFCFQYLFHLQLPIFESLRSELLDNDSPELLIKSIREFQGSTETSLDEELSTLVVARVKGILLQYKELEGLIEKNLRNWKLSRISKVEHTMLLIATYELLNEKQTSKNVIINEAIEIAKKYGTEKSGPFINGILDNIAKA